MTWFFASNAVRGRTVERSPSQRRLLVYALKAVNLRTIRKRNGRVSLAWVVASVVVGLLSLAVRAIRWRVSYLFRGYPDVEQANDAPSQTRPAPDTTPVVGAEGGGGSLGFLTHGQALLIGFLNT